MADHVAIAGAGPVGLTLALALAREGARVTVLEREPELRQDLRAGSFHPPTLDMLAPLGITARMLESGIRIPRWQIRDRRQGLIAEWDLELLADVTHHPFRLHLEQHRVSGMLLDALHGTATVLFGHRVLKAADDGNGARLEYRHAGQGGVLECDWVIGADGARSVVRRGLGAQFKGFTWPERFVVISTPFDFGALGFTGNAYIADPDEWCAIFKVPHEGPPGLWRIAFPVFEHESDAEALSAARVQHRLRDIGGERSYPVPYRSIYRVHQRVASTWRRGRILIAGDAAHLNNPLGGFGLNGGIHDAINLAEKLGRVMRGAGPDALLDLYAKQRRSANIEFIQEQSIRNKQLLEERDPGEKAKRWEELRRIAASPELARVFLLRSSMIQSVQRAAEITL